MIIENLPYTGLHFKFLEINSQEIIVSSIHNGFPNGKSINLRNKSKPLRKNNHLTKTKIKMILSTTLNIRHDRTLLNFGRTVESVSYEKNRSVIGRKLLWSTKCCFEQRHIVTSTVLNNDTLGYVLILKKKFSNSKINF